MSHQRYQSRGFTLIEVLVAVALMAMIATILIASLELGGHAWQRVTRIATSTEEIAQAQDFLRDRLSTIYPYEATDDNPPMPLVSDGRELEFSAPSPAALSSGMLRYRIAVNVTSGALEVSARPDKGLALTQSAPEPAAESLLAHVTSMSVQFWQREPNESGRWVSRWSDTRELPRLVRVDVDFGAKDPRRWPPLYVEPRVDTAVTCQFDIVSRRCRSRT